MRPKRDHVITWSDAAWPSRLIAALVLSPEGQWMWTTWRVPRPVVARLVGRKDIQVTFLEFAALVVTLKTFQGMLSSQTSTTYVDNQAVLGAMVRGSCRAPDINQVIGQVWLLFDRSGILIHLAISKRREYSG